MAVTAEAKRKGASLGVPGRFPGRDVACALKDEQEYSRSRGWERKFQEREIAQLKVQECEEPLYIVNAKQLGITGGQ